MIHRLKSAEYKKMFWLDRSQSLMSDKSIALARQNNKNHYELVVEQNLLKEGEPSRFKDWHPWRTRDKKRLV